MGYIEAVILGLVQGLTEFLPVSSSGHLVIVQDFLGVSQEGVTFEIMVHFGTALSVFWVFGYDILRILRGFWHEKRERHFALMLFFGIIPTGLMGFFFKDSFSLLYESTITVGFMLLITGLILYTLNKFIPGTKGEQDMKISDALLISVAQGFAIIPGISRSGATITSALRLGLDQETAVRYSFLVSIPVILGGTLMELGDLGREGFSGLTGSVLMGTCASFMAGIFAIRLFMKFLKTGQFQYFAYYCWFAGAVTILLKLTIL